MATLFDDILVRGVRAGQIPARTQQSRDWFRDVARGVAKSKADPTKILRGYENKKSRPLIGRMYHFFYDPKGKKTLPYYDRFPLIFMVGPASDGFYGINLHYLPPTLRARLMDSLYDVTNNTKYDETTRLRLSYNILSGAARFKFFKPTFKHYLADHVGSRFIEINSTEWDIALMLPTQRFEKASAAKVYSDSRKKI